MPEIIKMVSLEGFTYVSGQGGTPALIKDVSYVEEAAVLNVIGTLGSEPIVGQVVHVGLSSPPLYNGSATIPPVTNEVVLLFSNIANTGTIPTSGTLVEIASGTISGTITLMVQGY